MFVIYIEFSITRGICEVHPQAKLKLISSLIKSYLHTYCVNAIVVNNNNNNNNNNNETAFNYLINISNVSSLKKFFCVLILSCVTVVLICHPCMSTFGYYVFWIWKGCICHFTKWQIHPFHIQGRQQPRQRECLQRWWSLVVSGSLWRDTKVTYI